MNQLEITFFTVTPVQINGSVLFKNNLANPVVWNIFQVKKSYFMNQLEIIFLYCIE